MIRRRLLIGLAALAAIVGVFAILAIALLTTETGLRIVLRGLSPFLPAELEFQAVEGRLISPITIHGLTYSTETLRVEIDESEVEWQLKHLWRERLVITRLRVHGVRHESRAPAEEPSDERFELPRRVELPLQLVLEDARVEDLSLAEQATEPLRIESVSFNATWDHDELSIGDLRVTAADFDVRGAATTVLRGKYPVDADATYAVRLEGYAPVNGTIALTGNLETLQVAQEIQSPYGAHVDLELAGLLEEPRVSGELNVTDARLAAIHAEWPAITVNAQLQVAGDARNLPVELTMEAMAPDFGQVQASLAGKLSSEMAMIDSLIVKLAGQESRLEAKGEMVWSGEQPQVDLEARWQGLAWPLGDEPDVLSPEGELTVRGHLDDYTVALNGLLELHDQTSGRVIATGSGDRDSLMLSTLEAHVLDGVVRGMADFRWQPDVASNYMLELTDIDPAALAKEWPGQLSGRLRGQAAVKEGRLTVNIEELGAAGRLRSYDVRLDAAGGYDAGLIRVSRLQLTSGSTRVRADGQLGSSSEFRWSIRSDNLGSLFPDAAGALTGEGAIRGDLSEPRLSARLSGSSLAYQAHRLQGLELDMDLDISGAGESRLEAELRGATTLNVDIQALNLAMAGRAQEHQVRLTAKTEAGETELVASGVLDGAVWRFSLTQARFGYAPLDDWTLRNAVQGKISREAVMLSTACWESGSAELCLSGKLSPDERVAQFRLDELPLTYLAPVLPADLRLEGTVSGAGEAQWPPGDKLPRASVRMATTASRIVSVREAEEAAVVEFDPGKLTLDLLASGAVTMGIEVPGRKAGGLSAALELRDSQTEFLDRPLSGRVELELQDIDFIADLVPEVDTLEGRIDGDIRVSGSLAAPQLSGELVLTEGTASLTGPELQVREISISLAGGENGQIAVEAHAKSAGGTLNVTGTANVTAKTYTADLKVSGENFRVLNTSEADIFASPDLTLRLSPKAIQVRGEVLVPRADIKVNTVPESAITPSDDQIIVRPEGEGARARAAELSARVKLVLGENVRFEGFGLEARLAGEVTAIEKPGEPTTATGEIRVAEGRYQAYGQNLDIEKGRLIFAGGPLTQPGLDVRAIRKPTEGIVVGVRVKGTLRQPEFSLFSDPSMSQSEQLSYLVLGRPLGEGTSEENSALNRAAIALGMRGGNFLAKRLGGALGVDEIGIQSAPGETAEQAALVIGKYLSPRLYVIYGIGLIEPVSTLRLQYALSSRWKLVTESSALQSGGDIIYTIER